MTRKPVRRGPLPRGSALLGGLLLVASLAACSADADADADADAPSQPSPSSEEPTASTAAAPLPSVGTSIEPGTYLVPASTWSSVDFTITFGEGWQVSEGDWFEANGSQIDAFNLSPFVVEKIYADACRGDRGAQIEVGPEVDDLVDALLAQSGTAKTTEQTTLGGYPATRVDLRVPARMQRENCGTGPGTGMQIWLNGPENYLYLGPHGLLSIYVVDVDGTRAVFQSQYKPAHTSNEDRVELQHALDSIQIEK